MSMLTRLSRWVGGIEKTKKKRDPKLVLFDDDVTAVNAYCTTGLRHLRKGVLPLDIATIKDLLRFYVTISQGRIDEERIIVDSVNNTFAEWFFAGSTQVTGNLINEDDRRAVGNASVF